MLRVFSGDGASDTTPCAPHDFSSLNPGPAAGQAAGTGSHASNPVALVSPFRTRQTPYPSRHSTRGLSRHADGRAAMYAAAAVAAAAGWLGWWATAGSGPSRPTPGPTRMPQMRGRGPAAASQDEPPTNARRAARDSESTYRATSGHGGAEDARGRGEAVPPVA